MVASGLQEKMIKICEEFTDKVPHNVVIKEPYIPYIPENWNRILVLAESQNLAKEEDRKPLREKNKRERFLRLYEERKSSGYLGIGPWDDGHMKIALKAIEPYLKMENGGLNIDEVAVSNAVPWSLVEGNSNKSPTEELKELAVEFWKRIFSVWLPNDNNFEIFTFGRTAQRIIYNAGKESKFLYLPAGQHFNGGKSFFDCQDLLKRYPEVEKVKKELEQLPLLKDTKLGDSHIFFACHAVSQANIGFPK